MFDKTVYVSWFPHSQALADDLAVFDSDGSKRFVVLPDSPVSWPVVRTLEDAGYTLSWIQAAAGSSAQMPAALYRIEKR